MDLEFRYGGWEDVIKFYFAVAEGHAGDSRILSAPTEHNSLQDTPFREMKITGGLSHVVARKAFEVICLRILKNTEKDEFREPSWAYLVNYEDMFNILLHFFRLKNDPSSRPRFVNLKYYGPGDRGYSRHTLIAAAFLEELVNRTWPTNERLPDSWDYDDVRERLRKSRQKMLEILYGLCRLDLLTPRANQINGSHMNWLKGMALKESECATVEDAVYKMNQAARVWHILRVIREAHGRQIKIQRAKQTAANAKEELKKLRA